MTFGGKGPPDNVMYFNQMYTNKQANKGLLDKAALWKLKDESPRQKGDLDESAHLGNEPQRPCKQGHVDKLITTPIRLCWTGRSAQ